MTTHTASALAGHTDDACLTGSDAHELCERWAYWATARRFYAPAPVAADLLARLTAHPRAFVRLGQAPDAASLPPDLWAINLAVSGKDMDADRVAFELFYRHRVKCIKAVAAELGVSRKTFYARALRFRDRVVRESLNIQAAMTAGD